MASAEAPRKSEALAQWLQTTKDKLNAEGFCPEPEMLKKAIMPKVAEGLRNMTQGAPPEVRNQFKAALEDNKVLPSFEADLEGLRAAVDRCISILAGGGAGPAPAAKAEPEEKVAEDAEEDAGDMDDPFAMMGGMGEEEVYEVTLAPAADVAAEKEAARQAAAAVTGAAAGKKALVDYLEATIAKLSADGFAPDAETLKTKIMPSVVNGVKGMSGGAPQAVRDKFKDAFMSNKVIPSFEADLDGFRTAIEQCLAVMQE